MCNALARSRAIARACVLLGAAATALGLAVTVPPAAVAADGCPNAAVRAQQKATDLPDCRAYELVNPPGDDIGEVNRVPNVSDDGETAVYSSVVLGNDALGGATSSISVARRGPGGWTSASADPRSAGALPDNSNLGLTEVIAFSLDYRKALVSSSLPVLDSDQETLEDYYRVDVGLGTSTLMTPGLISYPFSPLGSSLDLDRVVFNVIADASEVGIYSYDGTTRQLLSIDENGVPFPSPNAAGKAADRGLGVGVGLGSHQPSVERGGVHAISDDAMRVYFYGSVQFEPEIGLAGSLYLNDHGTSIPISASKRTGDVGTMHSARFISATHDGSQVFFNSLAQLTDAATPGGGIYRYDVTQDVLTQITPDAGDPNGLHLLGGMASDDQTHLYFTSTSALAPGATAGLNNAYVWTEADDVRFIATVGSTDLIQRVTPDGRFALILSSESVGGAPNAGNPALYRWDNTTRELTCVSCRPDGSPSQGTAKIDDQGYGVPNAPNYHNRALTTDGSVLFMSTDRIVARDQTSAQDVYLYRDGRASLLTAGSGDSDSYAGDISDDAENAFVVTRSALLAADQDPEEDDVYDVRVDGGFLAPPPPRAPCRGDDCQVPARPAPAPVEAATSRPARSGNAPPVKTVRRLSATRLTASQRSTLARTGRVAVSVRVTGGGTVALRGRGRIAGKTATAGTGRATVLKLRSTTVKVTFRLTTAARRELARKKRLTFTLQTRLGGASKAITSTVRLSRR
jgi:hypothetical protein